MCNNFLQQMKIDALEQLISEDVKVQGQISCVMISELASWSSESSPELLSESSPELLPESSPEEMRLPAPLFCLGRRWRSPRSPQCPWTASSFALKKKPYLSMAGVAGVCQVGPCAHVQLPPPGRRRTDLFHGAPRKTHGGGALGWLLFVTAEPHSLGGAADSTEEDRQGRVRGASSLHNLPLESWAIPATETRLR
jgi:hypothetical protein